MEINEIKVHFIILPFVGDFRHSMKTDAFSSNVVVELIAENGEVRGYGEGAPRLYVTGESQASIPESIKFFLNSRSFPWTLQCISQIWDYVDRLPDGDRKSVV